MPAINLKALKSAEKVTDDGRVTELLLRGHESWGKENQLTITNGLADTELLPDASGSSIVVSKRASNALVVGAKLEAAAVKALAEKRGFQYEEGQEDRVIKYWASDDRRDRHGDRVVQEWVFDDFEQNPIMLHSHNWNGLPLGGVIDWKVAEREEKNYKGDALQLDGMFAKAEEYAFADSVFRLAKGGYMRMGSVGFFPGAVYDIKDKKERADLGLGPTGLILAENKLVEWSPCSIPANPGAGIVQAGLSQMKSKGLLKASDVQAIREIARVNMIRTPERWEEMDAQLRGAWHLLYPEVKLPEHKDVHAPVEFEELSDQTFSASTKSVGDILETLTTMVTDTLRRVEQKQDDIIQHLGIDTQEPSLQEVDMNDAADQQVADQQAQDDTANAGATDGGAPKAPAAKSGDADDDAITSHAAALLLV